MTKIKGTLTALLPRLSLVSILWTPALVQAAVLENPGHNEFYSGVGVISGWKCEANRITVSFDGQPRIPVLYGTQRPDTDGPCGDTNNGFVAIYNWARLGDGRHTAIVYDNGVEFGRSTFEVTTLGEEFVEGAEGECTVEDFPDPGETAEFRWNQNTQHLELVDGPPPPPAPGRNYTNNGVLENPGHNEFYSGVGVISGWKCEANRITVSFDGQPRIPVLYGTQRPDTDGPCGDTNNGFVAIYNWARLGDGRHTAIVYDNGVEFGRSTFEVTTLGEEFVEGAEGECTVEDFPDPGETAEFRWNQNTQHLELVDGRALASFRQFHVIAHELSENRDHDAECRAQLGSGFRLADWNDIVRYYEGGGSLAAFTAELKMVPAGEQPGPGELGNGYRISRDGNPIRSGRRHYFVARHDHNRPSHFAAHANLDNHHVSLGSWHGTGGYALCYGDDEPETFTDTLRSGGEGPEMVVIPAGTFRMGCLNDAGGCGSHQFPVHTVSVPSFALSKYEVTFAQWDACVAAGGCNGYRPDDQGWGRGDRPVIKVNWGDAQSYVAWLSAQTGKDYRLPSEAEWEYAARAGTETRYHWGDEIGVNRANCDGCGSQWDDRQTAPVGSFGPNAWGLHDMHGNVFEWPQDCWNDDYQGAPSDGSAWESGDCSRRILRSGSWAASPGILRSASRFIGTADTRARDNGFRIVRSLSSTRTHPPTFRGARVADQHYTQNMSISTLTLPVATGGTGSLTYRLSPALPAGLRFNARTRRLMGTPTSTLASTVYTYTVTDARGATASLTFRLSVEDDEVLVPEMVVIPAGNFRMGCLNDDGDCSPHEFPVHAVSVSQFALSKYEVTFAEWDACVAGGGCNGYRPDDEGWGRGTRPVINVGWTHAQSYVAWLSAQTGEYYRLPSEAEWEYAARAGTETKFHWGNEPGVNLANCRNNFCGDSFPNTAPVGQFAPNAWGLYDMHGNVWEWVQDCPSTSYAGAPSDGSAWEREGCRVTRVRRGGAWGDPPAGIRSAARGWNPAGTRTAYFGFRIARSLSSTRPPTPSFGGARIADQRYTQNMAISPLTLPTATGGTAPLTYRLSPALPAGLRFDERTRRLSGTPTETRASTVYTYTVTDARGATDSLTFRLRVEGAPTTLSFRGASIADQHYTQNTAFGPLTLPAATGGTGTLTYSLSPALPAGLRFDERTRRLSGTPTETRASTVYTYTVTDARGATDSLTFRLIGLRGRSGRVRVNITWNADVDLDLYVTNPCGQTFGFDEQSRATCQGFEGEWDYDDQGAGFRDDNPHAENIVWVDGAPQGRYLVSVNYFGGSVSTNYTVRIFYGSQSETHTGRIGPSDKGTRRRVADFQFR